MEPSLTSATSSRLADGAFGSLPQGRLEQYLADLLGEPVELVEVARTEGGWSRQTHRVNLRSRGGAELRLALRSEVSAGVLEKNLDREWAIMRAVSATAVPLPRLYGFEESGEILGRRFITTEWVDGTVANPWRRSGKEFLAAASARSLLGNSWTDDIVALHAIPAQMLREAGVDEQVTAGSYVEREVGRWSAKIESAPHHPGALVAEACHWLRDNPPDQVNETCVVHGDLRIGNMIIRDDRVAAFFDWEMAGLGDWRDELGYLLMPYNGGKLLEPTPPTAGGLMHPQEFLELYLSRSERQISAGETIYSMILGCVKMIAIFCTGIEEYAAGRSSDPRLPWLNIRLGGLMDDMDGLLEAGPPW